MADLEQRDGRLITNGPGCPCKYDIGQGYRLAWSIGPDGDAWPMLQDTRVTEPQRVPHAPAHFTQLAPHEMLISPPPAASTPAWEPPRCGHQKPNGWPCRNPVPQVGDKCRWHQQRTTT